MVNDLGIAKKYTLLALHGFNCGEAVPLRDLEEKSGISLEKLTQHFNDVVSYQKMRSVLDDPPTFDKKSILDGIFYQYFTPKVRLEDEMVIKEGFPLVYDILFKPDEAILLRLVDLGAYGERYVKKDELKLDFGLYLDVLEKSELIDIKDGKISLTRKFTYQVRTKRLDVLDRYTSYLAEYYKGNLFGLASKIRSIQYV